MTKSKILFLFILFLGLFLRLYGNDWDQGWHLHPDERFLTMVGIDTKIPTSFSNYMSPLVSSFNPTNKGHTFFVYGTFPLLINKIIAQYLSLDTYNQFTLLGRILSGIADFLVIIIIYKLVSLIEKKLKLHPSIKFLSAFLYAIAVLPIQLSHFFAVDTFLNFFCWLSLYFAIKLVMIRSHNIQKRYLVQAAYYSSLSGLFLGLALASKVSAIYFAPLIGMFMFVGLIISLTNASLDPSANRLRMTKGKVSHSESSESEDEESSEWNERKRGMVFAFMGTVIFFLSFYFAVRIGSPYYFETSNIFNLQLNVLFTNNIQTLKSFENPLALFPPAIQWLSKSNDFQVRNIIFFGVGPIYFLLAVVGSILLIRKKNGGVLISISWIVLFLVYQSFQFAKSMRYLIFIYPFLAIFAAVGFHYFFIKIKKLPVFLFYLSLVICTLSIIIWPLAFMSIYTKDHSRVSASQWMYEKISSGSTILTEYWDDPLPLMVREPRTRNYMGKEVHIFDPDSNDKWSIINEQLASADYYIMSSNRGWGSIGTVPKRYPTTSQFYKKMFEGTNGFTLAKEFTSYPSLRYLGIPIDFPDQWAEEAFTVYDHPQVLIFKKIKTP